MSASPTIHGSAVLVGARAVLIRGASGAGKSRLALALLDAAAAHRVPFARLVGDDRLLLEARHGRLLVRPAPPLSGLIEMHGVGIRKLAHEPVAVVGLVVDLAAADAARLPADDAATITLEGVRLPRLAVAPGHDALPRVLSLLQSGPGPGQAGIPGWTEESTHICPTVAGAPANRR